MGRARGRERPTFRVTSTATSGQRQTTAMPTVAVRASGRATALTSTIVHCWVMLVIDGAPGGRL